MSITIGIWCTEGILMCADTLYTGDHKSHQSKIFSIEYDDGSVTFALAGNEGYCRLVIQESREKIFDCPPEQRSLANVRRIIAKVIRSVYVDHIHTLPPHEQYEASIDLIVAIWSKQEGIGLFSTRKTALVEVDYYECMGSGSYLGRYLLSPIAGHRVAIRQASVLVMQAIDSIKIHDPNCGGATHIILLSNEGEITAPVRMGGILGFSQVTNFRSATDRLLMELTKAHLPSLEEFDALIASFRDEMADFYNTVSREFDASHQPQLKVTPPKKRK